MVDTIVYHPEDYRPLPKEAKLAARKEETRAAPSAPRVRTALRVRYAKEGRAVALSHLAGPEIALGEVNDLAIALGGYHLFHSTRAELLDRLREPSLAREARLRALELCQNPAERSLLERKLRR